MSVLDSLTRTLTFRAPGVAALLGLALTLPLAGCTGSPDDPEEADEEEIGEASEAVQSAVWPAVAAAITTPSQSRTQSETAVALGNASGFQNVVVAYNDESGTEATIAYTSSTRDVCTGATLAGFSYSLNQGATWTKGTKLSPPSGWAILWGDPAATGSSHNASYVFFSSLAAPMSKWPVSGCWSGSMVPPNLVDSPLGGACIARSSDGGQTFSFLAAQPCLSNQGHFYDGGAMAVTPNGGVYAAYEDVVTAKIDVWFAPTETSQLSLLASNPFPGKSIQSHPRIRATSDNKLIVLAQDGNGALWISKWSGSSWSTPTFVGNAALYPSVALSAPDDPSITVRTGPQFSFDIGATSAAGNDPIRILYAYRNPNFGNVLQLDVSYCNSDLTACGVPNAASWSGWHYPPVSWPSNTGDVFNPAITASGNQWKISFLSREMYAFGTSQVALLGADLRQTGSKALINIAQISYAERPCPDNRGYWGDYDGMVGLGVDLLTGKQRFLRPMSDSTSSNGGFGGCTRWQYTSDPLHLTSFRFN